MSNDTYFIKIFYTQSEILIGRKEEQNVVRKCVICIPGG